MLSFGEIHSFMGRKFRSGEVNLSGVVKLREVFLNDWLFSLSVVDVDTRTMSELPRLVEKYELRAADAIHLSSAFWLRDTIRLRGQRDRLEEPVEFGVADKRLAKVAHDCGFRIFNPEENG
jgi:hypothetical protein